MKRFFRVLSPAVFGMFALLLCLPLIGAAETIGKTFDHNLGIGTGSKSYEHRIDLPEALLAKGHVFVQRSLGLSGKLVIEREELKGTYYYVKVRLPKAWLIPAKGSLKVTLETGTQAPASPVLQAPAGLTVREPAGNPRFSWQGTGKFTAVSLLDRNSGQTVWERVILNATQTQVDENVLAIGHRYLWAVKQADETARYSTETSDAFSIKTRYERCTPCFGSGWVRCGPCGGSGHVIVNGPNGPISQTCNYCHGSGRERCTICRGTGQVEVPVIVHE
jgi:hypothetical protein